MATIQELFGIFACIAPVVAIVVYMVWATRRARCPHCNNPLPLDSEKCEHCGQ